MSGREAGRTCTYDRYPMNILAPAAGFDRFINRGVNAVCDKSLQCPDSNGLLSTGSDVTSIFALATTDPGADRREWVGFPNDFVGFFVFTLFN